MDGRSGPAAGTCRGRSERQRRQRVEHTQGVIRSVVASTVSNVTPLSHFLLFRLSFDAAEAKIFHRHARRAESYIDCISRCRTGGGRASSL